MNRTQEFVDNSESGREVGDSPTRPFLAALFTELESAQVRYCVMHSWDTLPDRIGSDLDLAVDPSDWKKLAAVVAALQGKGYLAVQYRSYAVNGARIDFGWSDRGLQFAAVDLICEYRYSGVTLNSGASLVSQRCWHPRGFWTASPITEFEYMTAKKILKASISEEAQKRLRELADEIPETEALNILEKMFGDDEAEPVWRSMHDGSFPSRLQDLRGKLRKRNWIKHPFSLVRYVAEDLVRLVGRWRRPTGLLLVVLGPDGVGKDTLLSAISERWSVPFRFVRHFHWRPGYVRKLKNFGGAVPEPHKNPPKGTLASVVALGSYVVDYCCANVPLAAFRARSGFVLFNRYFHDLLVDPKRYRYGGPMWLARVCAYLIPPRKRLVLVLDADEATVHGRKMELSLDEIKRQRSEYRRLLRYEGFVQLPAGGGVEDVVEKANLLIMGYLSRRFMLRYPEFSPQAIAQKC
jgi:hypothetical protein